MNDEEIVGFTLDDSDDDEPIPLIDPSETDPQREGVPGEDEENDLKAKYEGVNYSQADKINLIKKIELYLNDPDLKKIAMKKIHLAPYIDLGSMKKKKDFNNLDGPTLNYIYDELKDVNMNELMTDVAFEGYISINNVIDQVGSKYVPDLNGYSDELDTPENRTLMKQITIDNFDYYSGKISPQCILLFNTAKTMRRTCNRNRRIRIENEKETHVDRHEGENETHVDRHEGESEIIAIVPTKKSSGGLDDFIQKNNPFVDYSQTS